jgi:hypothetical protein
MRYLGRHEPAWRPDAAQRTAEVDMRLVQYARAKLDTSGERRAAIMSEIDRLLDYRLALTAEEL